jgi:hypothetical protein
MEMAGLKKLFSAEMVRVNETLRKYINARKATESFERSYNIFVMNPKISTEDVTLEERVKIRTDWVNAYGEELELRDELNALLA